MEAIFWTFTVAAVLFYHSSIFCRLDSTDNLFNYTDDGHMVEPSAGLCSCVVSSLGTSNATCNYKSSPRRYLENMEGWVELVHPNVHIGERGSSNEVVVLPPIEDDVNYKFEPEKTPDIVPGWPTPSGRTKLEVETYCNDKIRNSTSGKICAVIPSLTFDKFVQQCITDIQVWKEYDTSVATYLTRAIHILRHIYMDYRNFFKCNAFIPSLLCTTS